MSRREHRKSQRPGTGVRTGREGTNRLAVAALARMDAWIPDRVHAAGADAVTRARILIMAAATGIVGMSLLAFEEHTVSHWGWIAPGLALGFALTPLWLRWSSLEAAANYQVALTFSALVGVASVTGGHDPATLYGTVMIPPVAVLLCGFRWGLVWSAATALVLTAVWAVAEQGYDFPVRPVVASIAHTRFAALFHILLPIAVVSLTYEWMNRRGVAQVNAANAGLARQSSQQEAVAAVGVFALATPDPRPAVEFVLRTFVQHLDLAGAEILRFGDREDIARVAAEGHVPEDPEDAAAHVGRVMAAGRPLYYPARDGGPSGIVDLIAGRNVTWGVVVGYAEPERGFHTTDFHFVRSLSNLVAVAWDREADAAREEEARIELQASRQLQAIGQLAAGIAHEINTPAQYVGDNVRFLKEGFGDLTTLLARWREAMDRAEVSREELAKACEEADLDWLLEEIPQSLEQSDEGIRRVSEIVSAMKQFSHPGQDGKTPTDLNEAIRTTVTVARNEWKYAAAVELELDESLPRVSCEAGHMNQVILNLVVNAAQAMPSPPEGEPARKGRIAIRTGHAEGWAWIEVADDGVGIPEDARGSIFDPFFTTKDPGKGTGQGLAIARSYVVERHGGRIGLESEPGRGTTFRVELPIEPETEDAA